MTTVATVSERYVRDQAELDPIWALFVGVESRPGLGDLSPEGHAARAELHRSTLDQLAGADDVDDAGRLGRVYLQGLLQGELDLYEAREHERHLSALFGPQSIIRQVFDLLPQSDEAEWEVLAGVLDEVPRAIEGYRRTLETGLAADRVASLRCTEVVVNQCATWAGDGSGGWFSSLAGRYGEGRWASRITALGSMADAAYGQLGEWLRGTYAPRAATEDGVGEDRYRVWAHQNLGAVLDVDEAYRWGWEELGRLEREKAIEASRIIEGAGYQEVIATLSSDPSRGVEGIEPWKAWLQELTDKTIEFLDGSHFDIAEPLRRCEVCIPPDGSAAAPYYTPPGDGFVRPGRIWFPVMGRSWFPTWDLPTTVFHEAVPGHHLQFGSLRLFELTRAHQIGMNSAHAEGWALYAERLMDEMGRFDAPEFRLGFLSMQAFRAARVVVDIGLHTGRRIPEGWPHGGERWSYDVAVEYIERASGQSRAMCESEVLRYLSLPSQATGYKLGERVWLKGREKAKSAAAGSLDLKQWHSDVLPLGPLGLDPLESELSRIAALYQP